MSRAYDIEVDIPIRVVVSVRMKFIKTDINEDEFDVQVDDFEVVDAYIRNQECKPMTPEMKAAMAQFVANNQEILVDIANEYLS